METSLLNMYLDTVYCAIVPPGLLPRIQLECFGHLCDVCMCQYFNLKAANSAVVCVEMCLYLLLTGPSHDGSYGPYTQVCDATTIVGPL